MNLFKRCACPTTPCPHAYYYLFRHKGVLYRGTTHQANLILAQRQAAKVRGDVVAVEGGLPSTRPAVKLSKHVQEYVTFQQHTFPRVAARDARVLAGFLAVVTDKRIDQIGTFDLERWRSARLDVVSRSTVERDEHAVRGCLSYAEVLYKRRRFVSPFAGVETLKVDETSRRVLSAEELAIALQGLSPTLALICEVTLVCLPRLSEVLGLRRSDLGPSWIGFRRKGGTVTRVQVTADLLTKLHAQFRTDIQEYVFGDPGEAERGDLVAWLEGKQAAYSVAFTRAFRRLGLNGVSHHAMRHTGVTLMLERGENPRTIIELAGWSSPKMLMKYGHVRNASQAQAVAGNAAAVAAVLKRPAATVTPIKGERRG